MRFVIKSLYNILQSGLQIRQTTIRRYISERINESKVSDNSMLFAMLNIGTKEQILKEIRLQYDQGKFDLALYKMLTDYINEQSKRKALNSLFEDKKGM